MTPAGIEPATFRFVAQHRININAFEMPLKFPDIARNVAGNFYFGIDNN